MSEERQEVYKQFSSIQDQYTYFLLGIAGAAIAFAIQKTDTRLLELSLIPLGLAILSWGVSFYCGVAQINYKLVVLYQNYGLLQINDGLLKGVPDHPKYKAYAEQEIKKAMDANTEKANKYNIWQFRLIIIGMILFVGWHFLEMYLRTYK